MANLIRPNSLNNQKSEPTQQEIFSFKKIESWNEDGKIDMIENKLYPNYKLIRFSKPLYIEDKTSKIQIYKVTSNLRDLSFIGNYSKDEVGLIFESYDEFKKG